MGVKTTLSILRFEFHALGNVLIVASLMGMMFYLFGEREKDFAVLVSFAVIVFLVSLVRIDLGLGILVVGMLFSPETEVGQAGRRAITIRAEDLLILALAMAWVVRRVLMGAPWKSTPLNMPILLFSLSVLVSTMGGIALGWIDPTLAVFYVAKLIQFFLIFFFAVHFIEDDKQILFFLGLFLAVGVVVSVYGLTQVGEVYRITAPFEGGRPEPNTFGGYLITLIALGLPLAIYCPHPSLRLLLLGVSGLAFSALLFTLSRASFLGLTGMLVVLGVLTRSKWLWVGIALFALIHQSVLPQQVMDRVNYTFSSPRGEDVQLPVRLPFIGETVTVDSSTYERIDIWRKVLYTWTYDVYYFFLGWGVTRGNILDSQFARFLVEIGLVGVTLFSWLLWKTFKTAVWLRAHTERWVVKGFTVGYIACFIGILIHSVGTITFYVVRIMEPFWFLTGIMMWWYLEERGNREGVAEARSGSRVLWQPDLPWRQVDA